MTYQDTTALEKIERMPERIKVVQGGARAGKTDAILIILCDLSFEDHDDIISITTDSYPNLERGAMRDWQKLLKDTGRERYFRVNLSKHTWTNLCTGMVVEFFSCDTEDALGAGRGYLFINEASRITKETFEQLALRTTKEIWIDYNPTHEFWVHTDLLKRPKGVSYEKLTYRDNEAIPPAVLEELLSHKGDGTSNWWRVYGEGEVGSLEGNIYEGWHSEAQKPDGYILKRYGVDFGFSNDPTAVIAVYEAEDKSIFIETKLYETKLLTPQLVERLKELPEALFVCDNARPEIIAELQANGIRAIGCNKTPGEKMNGKLYNIELVKRRQVHYLSQDKDLEREYLTYAWRTRKSTGEKLDEPEDGNDHALDALAYAVRDMERRPIEYGGVR